MKVHVIKFIETDEARYRLRRCIRMPRGTLRPGLTISNCTRRPVDLIVEKVNWDHDNRKLYAILEEGSLRDDKCAEDIRDAYGPEWLIDSIPLTIEGLTTGATARRNAT